MGVEELATLAKHLGVDLTKIEAKSSALITALMNHAVE
jgi:hypothetical protein